jgi:hypothetical protein
LITPAGVSPTGIKGKVNLKLAAVVLLQMKFYYKPADAYFFPACVVNVTCFFPVLLCKRWHIFLVIAIDIAPVLYNNSFGKLALFQCVDKGGLQ